MALIMNAVLCAIQFYVIFKIFELERDHLNHYDVEKSMRNLVLPEQAIQIFLTIVHAMNSSWMLTSVQLPFAIWHSYCVIAQHAPVKAVIGKSEEFAKSLSGVRKIGFAKAAFYSLSLFWCYLRIYNMFYPTAPVQRPSSGGWRVELFESTSGLTSTPMSFRNLSLVAVGDVLHVDMDSNVGSAWSSFPRAARLRFQGGARQMPAGPFAWRFVGRIRVETAGDYTFCTESDDGSLFYLDLNPISAESQNVFYTLVIDNDGLHSATQRCQTVPLQQGTYHAKITGFESGGGVMMKLRHRGPDTAGQLVQTISIDATPPAEDSDTHNGWWLQIYSIPHATSSTPLQPDPHSLIGENRQLSAVRIDNEWQCSMLVPRCPDDWFMWRFYGRIEIRQPGFYEFCTESDDGSMLHIDMEPAAEARDPAQINYKLIVDNDGLHGPETRCSSQTLSSGRYHVRVTGFEGGGSPLMVFKYRGPDTANELVWVRSIDAAKGG